VFIYLSEEAQAKISAQFHLALKPNGLLLLGSAEKLNWAPGRFQPVPSTLSLYQRIGGTRASSDGPASLNSLPLSPPLFGATEPAQKERELARVRQELAAVQAEAAALEKSLQATRAGLMNAAEVLQRQNDSLTAAMVKVAMTSMAKTRLLASASHDLRQPLQTLTFIRGLLESLVDGRAADLVRRMEQTLLAMTGMLNALLNLNQVEAGEIDIDLQTFPIAALLESLREEFVFSACSKFLSLRMVYCGLMVRTDRRLLEQMIRNLMSNAIKYTNAGRILVGCRRHGEHLSIEVWDTGVGIAVDDVASIFEEYHGVSRGLVDAGEGLGVGLSIVRRLSERLDHPVSVRSVLGLGSAFAIKVRAVGVEMALDVLSTDGEAVNWDRTQPGEVRTAILLVEDDADLRALIGDLLLSMGYSVTAVTCYSSAVDALASLAAVPDLLLADLDIGGGGSGLDLAQLVRTRFSVTLPVLILTGDISTTTLSAISEQGCERLIKPILPLELIAAVRRILFEALPLPSGDAASSVSVFAPIMIVDDDPGLRRDLSAVLTVQGRAVEAFASAEQFLACCSVYPYPDQPVCVLIDSYLEGMDGLALLAVLAERYPNFRAIMITGRSDVPVAVAAMKAGALDFIEKPIKAVEIGIAIDYALASAGDAMAQAALKRDVFLKFGTLTKREWDVLHFLLAGAPNKNIAADLGISQRTVENHRASVMAKLKVKSMVALARLAILAGVSAP
jgi:two-component system CheB/CheR fusion protein